jgi:hypothetical protein
LTANKSVLEKGKEEIHATTERRWHERLGHVNIQTLSRIRKEGIVDGLDFAGDSIEGEEEICIPCLEGKQTEKKLGKGGQPKTTEVLELIHSDYCGPLAMETASGKRGYVSFQDDFSLPPMTPSFPQTASPPYFTLSSPLHSLLLHTAKIFDADCHLEIVLLS